jgi:hypothetical protein
MPSRRVQMVHTERRLEPSSQSPRTGLVAAGVGAAAFLAEELMHFLLVPNIGRRWERLLAESISAVIVAILTAMLINAVNRHRAATLLRLQVISEMNQHVRTALAKISLTAVGLENRECIRQISESVEHIEWALREVLLRRNPVMEKSNSGRPTKSQY